MDRFEGRGKPDRAFVMDGNVLGQTDMFRDGKSRLTNTLNSVGYLY